MSTEENPDVQIAVTSDPNAVPSDPNPSDPNPSDPNPSDPNAVTSVDPVDPVEVFKNELRKAFMNTVARTKRSMIIGLDTRRRGIASSAYFVKNIVVKKGLVDIYRSKGYLKDWTQDVINSFIDDISRSLKYNNVTIDTDTKTAAIVSVLDEIYNRPDLGTYKTITGGKKTRRVNKKTRRVNKKTRRVNKKTRRVNKKSRKNW